MTLHFSQIGLTLGRTFMQASRALGLGAVAARSTGSLVAVGDAAPLEVVGRDLHLYPVAGEDADAVHAHLSRTVGEHLMPVLELYFEHGVGQRLDDRALEHDRVFFGFGQVSSR